MDENKNYKFFPKNTNFSLKKIQTVKLLDETNEQAGFFIMTKL